MNSPVETIEAYLDGLLDRDGVKELEAWIKADAENLRLFVRETHQHRVIRDVVAGRRQVGRYFAATRAAQRVTALRFPVAFAVAAGLLAAVGLGLWMAGSGKREAGSGVVARVTEATDAGCWILACPAGGGDVGGKKIPVRVGMGVEAGTKMETDAGGRMALQYRGEVTRVEMGERSQLTIRDSQVAQFDAGRLAATVARRSAGHPFVVETPHARAEVKGTRFSVGVDGAQTRVDVSDGRVTMTRKEDGKSLALGTGQYAVAGSGIEFVAMALPGTAGSAATAPANWSGFKAGVVFGKTLFEENFDGTLEKWDVLIGTTGKFKPAVGDPAPYVTVSKGIRHVENPNIPSKVSVLDSCLVLDPRNEPARCVAIRSKMPIHADSFMIEMNCGYAQTQDKVRVGTHSDGIEIPDGGLVVLQACDNPGLSPNMAPVRWIFTLVKETAEGKEWKRLAYNPWGALANVCQVRAKDAKVMIGIEGSGACLHVKSIVVREVREKDAKKP